MGHVTNDTSGILSVRRRGVIQRSFDAVTKKFIKGKEGHDKDVAPSRKAPPDDMDNILSVKGQEKR